MVNHSINTTEVIITPEIDELWSYVQNKAKQWWLWYALDKISLKVVAYIFGTRCDSTVELLLKKLENFKVTFYFTDGCGSYARLLASKKHIVSKRYTQRIERSNLNLRTRCKSLARKRPFAFLNQLIFMIKLLAHLVNILPFNMFICKIEALPFILLFFIT